MNDNLNSENKSSLLGELDDINGLLDFAISKARKLESDPNLLKSIELENEKISSTKQNTEEEVIVKPSNWDNIKSAALEDAMNSFEEQEVTKAKDTTKARSISKKVTKKLDDNWEDDPF